MVLKIDGLKIDLLSKNTSGPLSWIKDGTLDLLLFVKIPLIKYFS